MKKKDKADIVKLVDELLNYAVSCGASDVHFEPTRKNLVVKFRLDGVLSTIEELPIFISDKVIGRLKVLGGLLTYRKDIPQEGRIPGQEDSTAGGKVVDKRLAIFPTVHGQRAVVRLLYEDTSLTSLEELGFSDFIYARLKAIAAQNQGVLLLTGPAGSGKSTTLAAILRDILNEFGGKSIVTLEDPVERHIEGVTQIQIPSAGDMTFPVALRSLLRQDPQVLMIGEIRDAETAKIVIEAGLTGHLLMSTMHSGSPAGALLRLLEMGIEPYQVTSSISAVLNQRLVRKLCNKCKKKSVQNTFDAAGCGECFNTGFKGRVLIAEMVQLDGRLREAILAKRDLDELEGILRDRGHMNMAQDGQRLVSMGVTTRQEVNKVCGIMGND
jgi:type II secretory ATPase GspE/PulE/Tfp pilus assembly ATPase PilB-like protein